MIQLVFSFWFCNLISDETNSTKKIKLTLKDFLRRQNLLLHGEESRLYRFIPVILFEIIDRMLHILELEDYGLIDIKNYLSHKIAEQIELKKNNPNVNENRKVMKHKQSIDSLRDDNGSGTDTPSNSSIDDQGLNDDLIDSLILDDDQLQSSKTVGKSRENSNGLDRANDDDDLQSMIINGYKWNEKIKTVEINRTVSKDSFVEILINQTRIDQQLADRIVELERLINRIPEWRELIREENELEILCGLLTNWLESFDVSSIYRQ